MPVRKTDVEARPRRAWRGLQARCEAAGSSIPWSISRKSPLSCSGSSASKRSQTPRSLRIIHRQVVEVDLADLDALVGEPVLDALLGLGDLKCVLRGVRVDEERHLVAQALHLEKPLAAENGEQVLLLLGQLHGRHRPALPAVLSVVGKNRISLGVLAASVLATRCDKTLWRR